MDYPIYEENKFIFKPTWESKFSEKENRKYTFNYGRVLLYPFCFRDCEHQIITVIRFFFFIFLLAMTLASIGVYATEYIEVKHENDGNSWFWPLRPMNFLMIFTLIYFIGVIVAGCIFKNFFTPSPKWFFYLQTLHIALLSCSIVSIIFYATTILPNSTYLPQDLATIIITTFTIWFDFILGTYYFEPYWFVYPVILLNSYFLLTLIFSPWIVVFPALGWFQHFFQTFFNVVFVNIITIVLHVVISMITKLRYYYLMKESPYLVNITKLQPQIDPKPTAKEEDHAIL